MLVCFPYKSNYSRPSVSGALDRLMHCVVKMPYPMHLLIKSCHTAFVMLKYILHSLFSYSR